MDFDVRHGGFFFGNIPFVKQNFSPVIFAIIGISGLPMAIHIVQEWLKKRRAIDA